MKICTCPAYKFPLHKCRNNRGNAKMWIKNKKYASRANEFLIHTVEAIGKFEKKVKNNFEKMYESS